MWKILAFALWIIKFPLHTRHSTPIYLMKVFRKIKGIRRPDNILSMVRSFLFSSGNTVSSTTNTLRNNRDLPIFHTTGEWISEGGCRCIYEVIVTDTHLDGDRGNGVRAREGRRKKSGRFDNRVLVSRRGYEPPPPGRILVKLVSKDTRGKKKVRRGEREEREGKSNTRSMTIKIDEQRLILCKGSGLIPLLIRLSRRAHENITRARIFNFSQKIKPAAFDCVTSKRRRGKR